MNGARSAPGRRGRLWAIPGQQELRYRLLLLLWRGWRLLESVAGSGCRGRETHTRRQRHGDDVNSNGGALLFTLDRCYSPSTAVVVQLVRQQRLNRYY